MDSNSNSKVMMDLVRLDTEVRQKAKEYLNDITQDNLKAFAESTKFIAQSTLENYFLAIDDLYTNGVLKIKDDNTFNKFIDFHHGYRAQMKQWVSANEIAIVEMKVPPTLKYPTREDTISDTIKRPTLITGIGTLAAVGLFIFTEIWIAVAAELLALGVALYTYRKRKEVRKKEYAFRLKEYEMQIEQEKARLINGLIKDLKTWLGNAEAFSNGILSKFGVE